MGRARPHPRVVKIENVGDFVLATPKRAETEKVKLRRGNIDKVGSGALQELAAFPVKWPKRAPADGTHPEQVKAALLASMGEGSGSAEKRR